MEDRAKNYAAEKEHYRYKNTARNRERHDNSYIFNTLNESAKPVSDYGSSGEEKRD